MSSWYSRTTTADDFLSAARAHPEKVLIASDFDGTLSEIVPDPEESRLIDAAAVALGDLGGLVGQIAIITGRAADTVRRLGELDQRRGLDNLIVLGQYGVERWDAATGESTPATVPEKILALRRPLDDLLDAPQFAGVHIEDKGRALGIHTRRTADPGRTYDLLLPHLQQLAAEYGVVLEPGRSVLELRASSSTKADALGALIRETGATAVAMCGDDLGDVAAFRLLDDLAGDGLVTCRVLAASDEQPGLLGGADVIADGPGGVASWLQGLADALKAGARQPD